VALLDYSAVPMVTAKFAASICRGTADGLSLMNGGVHFGFATPQDRPVVINE
jgi:hypothetical protein